MNIRSVLAVTVLTSMAFGVAANANPRPANLSDDIPALVHAPISITAPGDVPGFALPEMR